MRLYRHRVEEWPRLRPGQVNLFVRVDPFPDGGRLETAYVAESRAEADRLLKLSEEADMVKAEKLLRQGVEFEEALRRAAPKKRRAR